MNLPGIAEARREAVRLVGAILGDEPEEFWRGKAFDLDVCNCEREVLFTISLGCIDGAPGVQPVAECPAEE